MATGKLLRRLVARRHRTDEPRPHTASTFDAGRSLDDKATYSSCYAPMVSMYFDQMGDVRACCQNSAGLLGSVRSQSLREIWTGSQAEQLRSALEQHDFSVGCGFCEWQTAENGYSAFARGFDQYPTASARPEWPAQMEFSMTNSCNLQCIMCNGDWSSSIRAHREHRPPLPEVYGDAFFEQLAEFLPHLQRAKFLGGEPFLGKEPLRVLEMMVELGLDTPITVTTNATQWSPRVQRICESLNASIVVSLDGISKDTYESIRVGADFSTVMANIDHFLDTVDNRSTHVSLAHCLMTTNWHEFVDLLAYAEANGLDGVGVNSVIFPHSLSLYQLDERELSEVVARMEDQDSGPARALDRFRPVWEEQLAALQNRLQVLQSDGGAGSLNPWALEQPDSNPAASSTPASDATAIAELTAWSTEAPQLVRCASGSAMVDGSEIDRPILEVDSRFAELVGLHPSDLVGEPMNRLFDALADAFGGTLAPVACVDERRPNHLTATFGTTEQPTAQEVQVVFVAAGDEIHALFGQRARVRRRGDGETPS